MYDHSFAAGELENAIGGVKIAWSARYRCVYGKVGAFGGVGCVWDDCMG